MLRFSQVGGTQFRYSDLSFILNLIEALRHVHLHIPYALWCDLYSLPCFDLCIAFSSMSHYQCSHAAGNLGLIEPGITLVCHFPMAML